MSICRASTTTLSLVALIIFSTAVIAEPLGLPPVPIPADNPQSAAKIKLGDRLFNDERFSADGKVSCATCHDPAKAFTDNLKVSKGFNKLTGTRNAPTVINAAYLKTQFWDGREPDLESQSKQPPVNPVEGGLPNHEPILAVIRGDGEYVKAFNDVFGVNAEAITMEHVSKAIASFERTIIAGDSPFDRYHYGGDAKAMSAAAIRGFAVFTGQGRCVSCHLIEQTQALFTDSRFHNIGVGFKRIRGKESEIAAKFLTAKQGGANVDVTVLADKDASELGRFAVSENVTDVGTFKTSTLRNVDLTAPYMHDGSLKTLKEVVSFYNNGGRINKNDPLSGFLSGGIRPLNLTDQQQADLVAFLKALTSPKIPSASTSNSAGLAGNSGGTRNE